uniref:Fibroblast growth factor receptor substrate 3 n=1 Tax=Cyanistes caeruleus TaxID=156563 RepID=A0A8C0ZGM0_CYACU
MGSCCSCLCTDSIPDNHPTKFKVTNVDDEGHELGSGVMELTQRELILHTHKRDAVRWPYLCLRRYGFDSNLFSFESGRRCHTGQGIFAFKCSRAEEIFNLLQDLMQCNSINVVEEPVVITRNSQPSDRERARSPQRPTTTDKFLSPGGFSAALLWSLLSPPFTVPLLLSLQSHTYVNTATGEPRGRHCMHSLPEAHPPFPPRNHSCSLEDRNPQVFLQPGEVKFVLAPSSGYRRLCRHPRECRPHLCPPNNNNNECQEGCPSPQCVYENLNGLVAPGTSSLCRAGRSKAAREDGSRCQRRSALLHYENLPALPPDPRVAPPASPGARRTDSYAVIDLKKTAAMSSLQRALPRDDGTSRKTRHNSTDLPL